MKVSFWNKCFDGLSDKKGNPRPLKDGDKDKLGISSPIIEILKTYLNR